MLFIPEMRGVELEAMFHQEGHIFLLEGALAVVLDLAGEILEDLRHATDADAEGGIALLPGEVTHLRGRAAEPVGAVALHIADDGAGGLVPGEAEEEVHMVSAPARAHKQAAAPAEDAAEVGMEAVAVNVGEERDAVLGAEDGVEVDAGE